MSENKSNANGAANHGHSKGSGSSEMKINHHQFSLDSFERERAWEEKRRFFKDYCVNRYQWYNYPKWRYVAPFPLHVDFEASLSCNLRCPMCFREEIEFSKKGHMDWDLYKKGIDECAANDLYSIRLSWRGESTLHPKIVDMVRYAKEKGIKEVSFISNGMRLEGALAEGLIRAGLDYLTVSVDGLEPYYNKLRTPSTYQETRERLKNFYDLKNRIGDGYPLLKIQGIWPYIQEDAQKFYNDFKDRTDKINFDPYHDYSLHVVEQDPSQVCQYPWQRVTITYSGKTPMCIADWNQCAFLGDLNTMTIKEMWLGEKMEAFRNKHLNGQRLTVDCCARCHRPAVEQVGDRPEGLDLSNGKSPNGQHGQKAALAILQTSSSGGGCGDGCSH